MPGVKLGCFTDIGAIIYTGCLLCLQSYMGVNLIQRLFIYSGLLIGLQSFMGVITGTGSNIYTALQLCSSVMPGVTLFVHVQGRTYTHSVCYVCSLLLVHTYTQVLFCLLPYLVLIQWLFLIQAVTLGGMQNPKETALFKYFWPRLNINCVMCEAFIA